MNRNEVQEIVYNISKNRNLRAGLIQSVWHNQKHNEMVGYNDISTFRKHFVDFYGTTPSTFKSKEDTEDKK